MQRYIVEVHDINGNSDRRWTNENGDLHREDGPAIERSSGSKEWWINGQLHRDDGPAIEDSNGFKAWIINGVKHRKDGPALEFPHGYKEWFINGVQYTEEEFNLQINSYHGKVVEIDGKKYQLKEV